MNDARGNELEVGQHVAVADRSTVYLCRVGEFKTRRRYGKHYDTVICHYDEPKEVKYNHRALRNADGTYQKDANNQFVYSYDTKIIRTIEVWYPSQVVIVENL